MQIYIDSPFSFVVYLPITQLTIPYGVHPIKG
jgi:hypothetical protein